MAQICSGLRMTAALGKCPEKGEVLGCRMMSILVTLYYAVSNDDELLQIPQSRLL